MRHYDVAFSDRKRTRGVVAFDAQDAVVLAGGKRLRHVRQDARYSDVVVFAVTLTGRREVRAYVYTKGALK